MLVKSGRIYDSYKVVGERKRNMRYLSFILPLALLASYELGATESVYKKQYKEHYKPLVNPGQGWMAWQCAGWEKTSSRVSVGMIYDRLYWSDFEPENGVYDWTKIEKLLEFAASKGVPAAFRIICASSGDAKSYETPKWVFELGAKGDAFVSPRTEIGRVDDYVPHFDDPIFLKYHARFIRRLAEKFDGDPRIAGIDLGSYGNWGEWHCCHLPPYDNGKTGQKVYPVETRRAIIDAYLSNFKKTPIVSLTDDQECLAYSVVDGRYSRVGLRRDGVGAPWIQKDWAGSERYAGVKEMSEIWKTKPIWFETYASVLFMSEKKGWDMEAMVEWMASNHVTCVNSHPLIDKDDPKFAKLWRKVDLFAGARLVPNCSVVRKLKNGFEVKVYAENKGVGVMALPFDILLEILDVNGSVIASSRGCELPNDWMPGAFEIDEFLPASLEEIDRTKKMRIRLVHKYNIFKDFLFAVEGAENGLVVWEKE